WWTSSSRSSMFSTHFKTVNDSLGHGAGDDVLVGIARHLRRLTREEDVIGRLGGDEFVLVLAATDRAGAEHLVERIRVAIGTAGIETSAGPAAVTVSVGVATDPRADRKGPARQGSPASN
ncbi:MAG TPA: GGDEF domain-containing protein, partial [Actinomycetota bacterium]|nr:GGDEF domain-containing protein [Actinomycetota bacterium]